MKISIITVVYNNVDTIRCAINSVLNQSFNNIEYIIIDGNSNDGTINIIKEYKDKISFFVSEDDLGLYHAMNKGLNMATGEIIGILNSDDLYFNNNIIENIVYEFTNDFNLDILYGNLIYVKRNNINKIIRKWVSCSYYLKYFEDGNVPPHPTLFVKKNVYNTMGFFNTNFKFAADYELMLRIFKINKFKSKHLDLFLIKMRLGGTTNKSIKNIYFGNIEIIKSWLTNNYKLPIFFLPKRFFKKLSQFI